jgi:predicted dehydrogenase
MAELSRRQLFSGLAMQAIQFPRKVRVALVGLQGHPGEITGPLPRLPDVELVGVCDDELKAAEGTLRRAKSNGHAYTNWREMLDKEKPDVVAACNAADRRPEVILEAIRRGLPWIAEKPLSNEEKLLADIRGALKKTPVRFSMLLPMRFDPPYLALRQIVDSGEIGEVAQISAQKSYKAGDRPEWMKNPKSYGGTFPWIGIHLIDLMRYTSKREFTSVMAMQAKVGDFPGIGSMENTTGAVFRLDNQGVGTLHMDYYRPDRAKTHGDDRVRLAGTKGVAEYTEATGVTILSNTRGPERLAELPARKSVFVDFLESVYLGKPQTLTEADIFKNCEISLAARAAAVSGKAVRL